MRHQSLFLSFALMTVLGAGCSHITERIDIDKRFLRMEIKDTGPRGKRAMATRWRFENTDLIVDVDRWRTCHRSNTRVYHLTRHRRRHIVKDQRVTYGVLGLGFAGGGAVLMATPDTFVSDQADDKDSARNAYMVLGAISAAVGLACGIAVLYDSIKAGDSSEDLGEKSFPGKQHPFTCAEDRGKEMAVTLTMPDGQEFTAQRRADGAFRFMLKTVARKGYSGSHTAVLKVGKREEPVSLMLWERYAKLVKAEMEAVR